MNEKTNRPDRKSRQSSNDLDKILNESTNSIFEGTRSVAKSSSSSGNPIIDKAKSEINAQADSMLREIEERRQRRAARQRELEQQVQAEAEAKARRIARIKAQEELDSKLRQASMNNGGSRPSEAAGSRPVPSVSTSDIKFSNASHNSHDILEQFSSTPSKSEAPQPRRSASQQKQSVQSPRPRQRRSVQSGETQVMPKISESKIHAQRSTQSRTPNGSARSREAQRAHASEQESAFKRNSAQGVRPRTTSASKSGSGQRAVNPSLQRNASRTVNKKAVNSKPKEVNVMKEIREWVIAIAIAVVVSLLIRNFVFTLVKVQGESMQPTLQNGDRLYVNRFFYSPQKGDVVIFRPASDPDRPYIKRVIATEGDTVFIDFQTGDVYVNGNIIDEPYIKDKTTRSGEYINNLIANGQYSKDNPIVIEKGKIFVMGDNRNNSKDSRVLGQIPKDELIGGAVFRFWPLSNFGSVSYDVSYLIEDENMNFRIAA